MTFQYKMATSGGRGIVSVGRRCRSNDMGALRIIRRNLCDTTTIPTASAVQLSPTALAASTTESSRTPTRPTLFWKHKSASSPGATRCLKRGVFGPLVDGGKIYLNHLGLVAVRGFSTVPAQGGDPKEDKDVAPGNSGDSSNSGGVEAAGDATTPDGDHVTGEKKGGEAPVPSVEATSVGADVKQDETDGVQGDDHPLASIPDDDGDPGPPPPLDPSIVTGPSPKVLKVMEDIDSLNFVEMAMLIDVFKEKLGLAEVPSLSFGGEGGGGFGDEEGGGSAPEAAKEKSTFNVKVTGFGDKAKIKVIKEIRAITGLGLREAKELVESLPQLVKEDLKPEDAEAMKAALEGAGAVVELV